MKKAAGSVTNRRLAAIKQQIQNMPRSRFALFQRENPQTPTAKVALAVFSANLRHSDYSPGAIVVKLIYTGK